MGPGNDMYESEEIIATRLFEKAKVSLSAFIHQFGPS